MSMQSCILYKIPADFIKRKGYIMQKNLKSVCLLMALLLAAGIVSCGKTEENETSTTTDTTAKTEETKEEGPTVYAADYLPDADYEGYAFRTVSNAYPNSFSIMTVADAAELTGETYNDALYHRNREIESTYNIVFAADYVENFWNMSEQFRKSALSSSDDYELNMLICRDAFSIAQEGLMIPIGQLPYCDITQPWYVETINDAMTIDGKLYFAYSDDAINLFEWTNLVLYNKQMALNYGLPELYDMVRDGTWTIDAFFSMAETVVTDVDGDGKYNDADVLGVISQYDFYYPTFWVGADQDTVRKDSNDLPYLAVKDDDQFFTLLNKIVEKTEQQGIYFDTFDDKKLAVTMTIGPDDQARNDGHTLFSKGVSLFEMTNVGSLQSIRDMEDDFGLLPVPKLSEDQANYRSRTIDGWLYCVPVSNTHIECTSVIMEAMAVGAKNTLVPAYYQVALREKYTRDPDSSEMLDIVYNTRAFDMGDVFWMDDIRNVFVGQMRNGKTDFASAVEKNLTKINTTIEKAIESFEKE